MGIELLSERSKVFDKADPRVVSAYVNQHVGHHKITLSGPSTQAMLSHRRLSTLDLCHISYGGLARVTSTSLRDRYHLQIVLRGSCFQRQMDYQRTLFAGDLIMINPQEPVDLTYSQDCEKFILKVPVDLMNAVSAEQYWARPKEGLRFDSHVYKLRDMQDIAKLLSLICHEVEMGNSLKAVEEHYVQIVTRKMLISLATNLDFKSKDVREEALKRVLGHIDENVKEDLIPEALASMANMSLRSFYDLFDQHVGLSPKRFILKRKLERIRAALVDPNCSARSVTELALDFGFTHLGRFAGDYKRQFAELPSQTLSRRSSKSDEGATLLRK